LTIALCLNCGELKFGAFCPCDKCQVGSSGNEDADTLFSDHFLSEVQLDEFSRVLKSLAERCSDSKLRYKAFLYYVSTNHPHILSTAFEPDVVQELKKLI
jgi:hypothetical protein